MRNTFLTTTALATLLLASPARADGVHMEATRYKVTLGGVIDAQSAFGFNRSGSAPAFGTPYNTIAIGTSTAVHLKAEATTARGMTYGAHIGLAPTTRSKTSVNYFNPHKTFVFVESGDLGRVEVGSNDGAGDMMTRGAGSIAAATGGVEGDFARYSGFDSLNAGAVIGLPRLPLDNATFGTLAPTSPSSEKSRKVTYLSPKFSGVQLGVSYTPDVSNLGTLFTQTVATNGSTKHGVSGGLLWSGKMQQAHHIEASVVGEWGQSTNAAINDTKAVIAGATWKYKDFKVAGSFGWLDSTDFGKAVAPASTSWFGTLGAGMGLDKLYASVTGMYGSRNDSTSWLVSAGLDYELAAGFLPYVEATYGTVETKTATGVQYYPRSAGRDYASATTPSASKSSSTALILGVKVKFESVI